jgi:hypothetical protein
MEKFILTVESLGDGILGQSPNEEKNETLDIFVFAILYLMFALSPLLSESFLQDKKQRIKKIIKKCFIISAFCF